LISHRIKLIILASVVFISRLPFLGAGYGLHDDAWRVANAAKEIALTGNYVMSRPPGHPLQEYIYSLVWQYGPYALNGLTAVLSVAAVVIFALILKSVDCKRYFEAGIAFAFVPVMFINSTNSLDFIWALMFLLVSMWFLLIHRTTLAAVMFALAIGCRITSILLLIPFVYMLIKLSNRQKIVPEIIKFLIIILFLGSLMYIQPYMKEGVAFLDVYTNYPSLYHSFREASLGVWGTLGLLAILIGIVSMILDIGRIKILLNEPGMHVSKVIVMSSIIAIAIYALLYLKLPHRAEYLIPAIPFVLILFSILLTRKVFILVCLLMVMSPFVLSYDKKQVQPYGMIFDDHFKRIEQILFVDRLFEAVDNLPEEKIVVVSGWFLPQIRAISSAKTDAKKIKDVIYIYLLDESQLRKFLGEDYQIYYIHVDREFTIQKHNLEVYGVDLVNAGCKSLVID